MPAVNVVLDAKSNRTLHLYVLGDERLKNLNSLTKTLGTSNNTSTDFHSSTLTLFLFPSKMQTWPLYVPFITVAFDAGIVVSFAVLAGGCSIFTSAADAEDERQRDREVPTWYN